MPIALALAAALALPSAAPADSLTNLSIDPAQVHVLVIPSQYRSISVGVRNSREMDLAVTSNPLQRTTIGDLAAAKLPEMTFASSFLSMFDVTSTEHGRFYQDNIHLAAAIGTFQPFIAATHEWDDLSDTGHVGFGAGAEIILAPHANIGSELIVFPSHGFLDDPAFPAAANDTRFLTRLEITF